MRERRGAVARREGRLGDVVPRRRQRPDGLVEVPRGAARVPLLARVGLERGEPRLLGPVRVQQVRAPAPRCGGSPRRPVVVADAAPRIGEVGQRPGAVVEELERTGRRRRLEAGRGALGGPQGRGCVHGHDAMARGGQGGGGRVGGDDARIGLVPTLTTPSPFPSSAPTGTTAKAHCTTRPAARNSRNAPRQARPRLEK